MELHDWIKYSFLPTVFNNATRLFPEFNFVRIGKNWVGFGNIFPNKNTKTQITFSSETPHLFIDNEGDFIITIEYIEKKYKLDILGSLEYLSDRTNLAIPEDILESEYLTNLFDYLKISEDINLYFRLCLLTGQSQEIEEAKDYLNCRGYNLQKINIMELGIHESRSKLIEFLLSRNHTIRKIEKYTNKTFNINNPKKIVFEKHGVEISIPYRVGGIITHFLFRDVPFIILIGETTFHDIIRIENEKTENKSKFFKKYKRGQQLLKYEGFFNINGVQNLHDLIVVEGEMDALHAKACGLSNVCCCRNQIMTKAQITDAIHRGVNKFILCFNSDKNNSIYLNARFIANIYKILEQNIKEIYVTSLPLILSRVDPDFFISKEGIEKFKIAIDNSIHYTVFLERHYMAKKRNIDSIINEIRDEIEEIQKKQEVEVNADLAEIDPKDSYSLIAYLKMQELLLRHDFISIPF